MKSDFLIAITQIAAEKNLPKEVVLQAVETALASAYKKDSEATGNILVRIDSNTGTVHVYAQKAVVEAVEDPRVDIALDEARRLKPDIQLGEIMQFEVTPANAGRIAAQTAKQVVLQRLREAEREMVYEEFSNREGDIVSGLIQRVDARNVVIDLGKTEGILPPTEQVRSEHYRPGQRMKFYLAEVHKSNRGPQLILSRSHKNLLKRLFELEVPEIYKGVVEIRSIAREPGYRSKVAVAAQQAGVDPVGSCVGLRGIRIQNIVNELGGERIDVVQWDPNPARFVANALSPAQVTSVSTSEEDNTASVIVPDRQLSLAIGKEGQNARLAAKLTGWRIDIRSESAMQEAGLAAAIVEEAPAEAVAEAAAEEVAPAEPVAEAAAEEVAPAAEEVATSEEPAAAVAEEAPAVAPAKPQVRFAEQVLSPAGDRGQAKGKRAKSRKGAAREELKPEGKVKKIKKARRPLLEEELEEEALEEEEIEQAPDSEVLSSETP
ncbi:MAG: transcription termination factor NusA [Dehalococcoidia bacterium]|nr:transcription termination factor NusA [Dehalococcoidia bacterium]